MANEAGDITPAQSEQSDRSKCERLAVGKASDAGRRRSTKPTLGKLLQKRRYELGLTQRVLAGQLGVKPAHVAFIETDRRRPSLGLLSRIATILRLDREKLFALAHPEAISLLSSRFKTKHQVARNQVWKEFTHNSALLAKHQVRPRELLVLAQVNLLGKITAPRNFLFILNAIRQAAEED
jgi:transcriptional regulator with XRE-family HTH domain